MRPETDHVNQKKYDQEKYDQYQLRPHERTLSTWTKK